MYNFSKGKGVRELAKIMICIKMILETEIVDYIIGIIDNIIRFLA
jgi:hypothetical protein